MSDPLPPEASAHRGLVPALRLFIGAGAIELRLIPIVANSIAIGRRPYNDVALDDLTVSGEHAMIRLVADECVICDLNSRNGTRVNGSPIQQRTLVDGDVIDIGIYRIRFEAPNAATPLTSPGSSSDAAPGRTGDRDGGTGTAVAPAAASEAGLEPMLAAAIEHLGGERKGQIQAIDQAINRIGGPAGQVAVVSRRKGGYFITHLEGLTFPQVNGELIGLVAHRLADGDLIELAGVMLRFKLLG